MIANYFRIAFRNLVKHKAFSFITILGMAVSLASCILIGLFVWDEVQYDNFHPDGDRTYRIYNIVDHEGVLSYLPIVPYPFASYMQQDFPEIESTLRILDAYGEQLFEKDGKKVLESGGMLVEPTAFDMLSLKVTSGYAATALVKPNTVALSSSLAKKYFDGQDPIGKILKVDHQDYEVTAVFADPPAHFHLKVNYLLSLSSTTWSTRFENNWQRQQLFTYIKLKPGTNAEDLEAKFKPFVEKYAYPTIQEKGFTYVPHLQNIRDIHLHSSNFEWEMARRGNAQSVYILSGTALMILLIACLNFVNLSTARSVKRMKEVGVRKVVGAYRRQLVFQFMAESVLFTFFGLLIAVGLAELALPSLNAIIDKNLAVPFQPEYVVSATLFCLILGLMAGSYPALQLSRFRPVQVLARKSQGRGDANIFRQSLVVIQFMLSFFLITASWVVLSQNHMIQTMNLGFDKEQVVIIPLSNVQTKHRDATKQRYTDNANIISATLAFGLPGDIVAGDEVIDPATGKTLSTNLFCVDNDYIKTLDMKIIAGRDFSPDHPSDSVDAFIVNETALATYGFGTPEEAIGKNLNWKRWDNGEMKEGKIIGVVQDFHFKSLREKMTPIVMQIFPQAAWKIALRIQPGHTEETIAFLKKTYESLESDWVFTYTFLDESLGDMYKSEQRLGKLFTIFTYLAIMVACLGLYGLVEYSVNQRIKEISIRKVFGANIPSLLILLTRNYFLLLTIAFLLIIPLSYYTARVWLDNFAYRIEISPLLFIKSALIILVITIFTVSYQSIHAALSNPARILKNE